MHRFYLSPDRCQAPTLRLEEREAHHALHVLRLQSGDEVVVLDGVGHEFRCRVTGVSRRDVTLAIEKTIEHPPLPSRITLLQAIPKGKIFENIVQKATELGTYRIVPLVTERVVKQVVPSRADQKMEKWETVAIEAVKQCGSPWLPLLEPAANLTEALQRKNTFDLSLVASLQPGSRHPRNWLETLPAAVSDRVASIAVWIGPEGDFTPDEINTIVDSGARPITLGPLVLRSETAAIYCLSTISYELSSRERS